jgi:hypothetical protein
LPQFIREKVINRSKLEAKKFEGENDLVRLVIPAKAGIPFVYGRLDPGPG